MFNILQVFVYHRPKRQLDPKDPCDTMISIIAEMFHEVRSVFEPIPREVLAGAAAG